jgi:hypothetical protein
LPAVVRERVAGVAGAVADVPADADLERPRLWVGGARVELGVKAPGLAAEHAGDPASAARRSPACVMCSAASSRVPSSMRTA